MKSNGNGCEIDLLFQITETLLTERHDLETVLNSVLSHLAAYGMERGIITIYDRSTSAARVEAAHSLTPAQLESIRYQSGEGIIGKVIQRKEPVLIESIDDEPRFLDRTGTRDKLDRTKIAFICVPVMTHSDEVVGRLRRRKIGGGDSMPGDAQICSCNNVSKAQICSAIRDENLTTLGEVKSCTKAGTGCGG